MKALMMLLAASFVVSSASAGPMKTFARCGGALFEGEIVVKLTSDNKFALVSIGGNDNGVTAMHLGPVSSFDFVSESGSERVIIAVDGGSEFHQYDMKNKRYKKIADLNCTIN